MAWILLKFEKSYEVMNDREKIFKMGLISFL